MLPWESQLNVGSFIPGLRNGNRRRRLNLTVEPTGCERNLGVNPAARVQSIPPLSNACLPVFMS